MPESVEVKHYDLGFYEPRGELFHCCFCDLEMRKLHVDSEMKTLPLPVTGGTLECVKVSRRQCNFDSLLLCCIEV